MAIPIITSALMRALVSLLNTLIERAQERGEELGIDPECLVIEHYALGVLDHAQIQDALQTSQDQFCRYQSTNDRWLELFAELIQHGGIDVNAFVENLWRADFFRLGGSPDVLWNQYPDLQRRVMIQTDRSLPRAWGDWILPLSEFMGIVENHLVDRNPIWSDLLGSELVLELLEEEPPSHAESTTIDVPVSALYINYAGALDAYLHACDEQIAHIDPRGYPRSVNRTVPLGDVYIPLRLVPLTASDDSADYIRYQSASYRNPDLQVLREPLAPQQLSAHPGLPVLEVVARQPQVLILGVSGSGKSTLLRYIVAEQVRMLRDTDAGGTQIEMRPDGSTTIRLSRRLPIYVDLAEYLDEHNGESLQDFIIRKGVELIQDQNIGPIMLDLMRQGQCILLLDGLDQAATEDQRRLLGIRISEAAAQWRMTGNHVIVTSRFEGYTTSPMPASFDTYVVRGLDRSQIGPFLLRWSVTLLRMRRPLISDEDALRRAETETLALVREITTNTRLYHLVNTPLMLRMLVGIYRPGMLMSPQRVAIYQLVADSLIREWRLPQGAADRPAVLEQDVTELLGGLAFWVQASRPAGMLTEQELREILAHIWGSMHPNLSPAQVNEAIEGFLRHMRLNPGVLTELAPQRYGFIYQALQEYFAARYLVSSYRHAPTRMRTYVHDPRWDEVIRLAVAFTAQRSREDAADLIEAAVLGRGARAERHGLHAGQFEDVLYRDLFFAARLLGSGIEVGPELAEYIASVLMQLWLDGDRDSVGRFSLLFDAARRHLIVLDGTVASWHALQIARHTLTSSDEHRRAYAVEALTFWPSHQAEARDALVQNGRDGSPLFKAAVAGALGRVGQLEIHAYRLLLSLVSDADERVSERAQRSLEAAAPVPGEALSMWIEFLRSGNPTRRRISLRVLGRMGVLPPIVISELLLLLGDPDPEIRQGAVDVLAGVSNLPDNVLTAICRAAMDTSADTETRIAAIRALSRPVELPHEVVDLLIDWTYDPDVAVRRASIHALGTCHNLSNDVMEALIERLDDPADSVRAAVTEPLARKGVDHPRAMHVLAHAVRDPIYSVRCSIATALRVFVNPNDDIRHALLALLNDREIVVRETTLETIAHLESPGAEIIDYLVSLCSVQDFNIGAKAVQSLARLRNLPPSALRSLVVALRNYWQQSGQLIADCLSEHEPLGPDIVNEIMDLAVLSRLGYSVAQRASTGLRALALEMLGCTLDEIPTVLRVLLEAAFQTDNPVEVRIAALRGLSHMRALPTNVRNEMLRLLNVNSLEVRCATGIALAHLIRRLPDPPFASEEMLALADALSRLLKEIPARASWESETHLQNDLLIALDWIVTRARPSLPRLSAQSELEDLAR